MRCMYTGINKICSRCNPGIRNHAVSTLILYLLFFSPGRAQTTSYTQLANELQFSRAINDKWAAELWMGGAFSNTPSDDRVLSTNIQRYFFLWTHYYLSPKWKLSSSFAYYYNKDVPDIGQYLSPEYRLTLQAMYFIHKTGYTLATRMRGEFRYMMNSDGVFEDKYRYRQMLKFVKPINSQVLRQGVFYFLTTEELLFKPQAKTKGVDFFDRNRFDIGGGYHCRHRWPSSDPDTPGGNPVRSRHALRSRTFAPEWPLGPGATQSTTRTVRRPPSKYSET